MSDLEQLAEAAGPAIIGQPHSVKALFDHTVSNHGQKIAVVSSYQGKIPWLDEVLKPPENALTLSYRQLDDLASNIAKNLSTKGIKRGMRFAALLNNSVELALCFWASVKLETVFVPLDARTANRTDEIQHLLSVSKPTLLVVTDGATAEALARANPIDLKEVQHKYVVQKPSTNLTWNSFEDLVVPRSYVNGTNGHHPPKHAKQNRELSNGSQYLNHESKELPHIATSDHHQNSTVYMMFTSGTSGPQKSCGMTDRNIWSSIEASQSFRPYDASTVVLHHLPSSHALGMLGLTHSFSKASSVVFPAPSFDARASLAAIEQFKCTHMAGVPTMILAMAQQTAFNPKSLASMKMIMMGGSIISPDIVAMCLDPNQFGASEVVRGYGLTEALSVCGTSTKTELKVDLGAVSQGSVAPGFRVKICAAGSQRILRREESGELHVSGPTVVEGYLHGNNDVFYSDEAGEHWFMTGDEAKMDKDGAIFILGRYKDIIIRGGENLSPALIENCLTKVVAQASVVGIPDEIAGEVPVAILSWDEGIDLPIEKLSRSVLGTLGLTCLPTSYLTLKELDLDNFPMTTSGKINKSRLKALVLQHLAQKAKNVSRNASKTVTESTRAAAQAKEIADIAADVSGQPHGSIPLTEPLNGLLDSINILRFRESIRRTLKMDISLERLMSSANLTALSHELRGLKDDDDSAKTADASPVGPPKVDDMVHTEGDEDKALRTQTTVENLLRRYQMSWNDVERVFPIPNISKRAFETMQPLTYTLRHSIIVRLSSTDAVRKALEKTVQRWSLFRSFAVVVDEIPLFVTVRQSERSNKVLFAETPDFAKASEVFSYRHPIAEMNNAHLAGGSPGARFLYGRVKESERSALIVVNNHLTFDALSMEAFLKDLKANLHDEEMPTSHTPFKKFADLHYQHSTSRPALRSASYHAERLRGIHKLANSVWPIQGSYGWSVGRETEERDKILADGGISSVLRFVGKTRLKTLPELRHKQITVPTLMKAACALMTAQLSQSPEVVFTQSQAGRSWPFLDESIARYLPSPITIGGMLVVGVVNRITISPTKTLGDFLQNLESEQKTLTKHCQAPMPQIMSRLSPEDARVFVSARRQLLNWNPNIGALIQEETKLDPDEFFQRLGVRTPPTRCLEWHVGTLGAERRGEGQGGGAVIGGGNTTAVVLAKIDGLQVEKREEAQGWVDCFMECLEWVADFGNWDRELGERMSTTTTPAEEE